VFFGFIYGLLYPALLGSMVYDLFFGDNFSGKHPGWWAQLGIVFIFMTDWWYTQNIKKMKEAEEQESQEKGLDPSSFLLIKTFGKKGEPTWLARFAGILGLMSAFGFAVAFNWAGHIGGTEEDVGYFVKAYGILTGLILIYLLFQFRTGFRAEYISLSILFGWLILLSYFYSSTDSDHGRILSINVFSIVLIYVGLNLYRTLKKFPVGPPSQ